MPVELGYPNGDMRTTGPKPTSFSVRPPLPPRYCHSICELSCDTAAREAVIARPPWLSAESLRLHP